MGSPSFRDVLHTYTVVKNIPDVWDIIHSLRDYFKGSSIAIESGIDRASGKQTIANLVTTLVDELDRRSKVYAENEALRVEIAKLRDRNRQESDTKMTLYEKNAGLQEKITDLQGQIIRIKDDQILQITGPTTHQLHVVK